MWFHRFYHEGWQGRTDIRPRPRPARPVRPPALRILQESHSTSLAKQIEKWSQTSSTAMPCYCICYALRSIPRLMRHPQHIINMHSVESIVTVDIHWRWYHLLPRSLCCPRVVWATMNDNVSESDTDFEEEGTNGAGGGIVRSALRNFFR